MVFTYYLICLDRNYNNEEVVGICKTLDHAKLLFKETLKKSATDTKLCRMVKTDAQGRVVEESIVELDDST